MQQVVKQQYLQIKNNTILHNSKEKKYPKSEVLCQQPDALLGHFFNKNSPSESL